MSLEPAPWETKRERTGLGNLRRRLATLYGEGATLEIERHDPGTRVVVAVPVVVALPPSSSRI